MVYMAAVVDKLVERTQQNRVPWKRSAGKSTLVASFGNLSVLISARTSGLNSEVKLSVLDEIGDEIDYAESDGYSSDRQSTQLQVLYIYVSKAQSSGIRPALGRINLPARRRAPGFLTVSRTGRVKLACPC